MTQTLDLPAQAANSHGLYYPMTFGEWCQLTNSLQPANLKVLVYLRTLDPFGNGGLQLNIAIVAEQLSLHPHTVSRVLKELAHENYIDLELKTVVVDVKLCKFSQPADREFDQTIESQPNDRNDDQMIETTIKRSQVDDCPVTEPASGKGFKKEPCTNVLKDLKQQTGTRAHRSDRGIDRGVDGTSVLRSLIDRTGIARNKTIDRLLDKMHQQQGAAAAAAAVENAISSLVEQSKAGKVHNPGGFLKAALERGFTSNGAKRAARLSAPAPIEPTVDHVEMAVDNALVMGDVAFAISKLQNLVEMGQQSRVRELIRSRRDWPLTFSDNRVKQR